MYLGSEHILGKSSRQLNVTNCGTPQSPIQTIQLTLCMLGNLACFFYFLFYIFFFIYLFIYLFYFFFFVCGFFLIYFFKTIFQEYHQTVGIQVRPDVLSGLIWVQTVCKSHQQTTNVTTSMERVNLCESHMNQSNKNSRRGLPTRYAPIRLVI